MPNDPAWINADSGAPEYNARELRRLDATLMAPGVADRFGARSGVRPGGLDAVALAGTTVTVRDLCAVVHTAAGGSQTGPYRVALQEETHELDPADGSNDRIDAIDLQVQDDDEDASGQRRARSLAVVGTPAGSPVAPTLSDNSVRLATVLVPAGGTPAPTLTYVAPYVAALGGVLPVRDVAELPADGRYEGMLAYDQGAGALVAFDGSAWPILAAPHVPEYVQFVANGSFLKGDYPWARYVVVHCQGGGGGGGGCAATGAGEGAVAGGGGGGGYAQRVIALADLGASETVTVGAAGSGGSAGANNGGAGGSSSFGAHASATGGGGGEGATASTGSNIGDGGFGGTGSGGSGGFNVSGDDGGNGVVDNNADNASGGQGNHGEGGGSYLAGSRRTNAATQGAAGIGGRANGGGGSGGHNRQSQSARAGGDGGLGIVIVEVH